MCGIAGILEPSGAREDLEGRVRSLLETMRYRGPDALGVHVAPGLALGNVRLAIQGIDPSGNQPIFNEDRTVAVVFNGEIYNFPELRRELEARGHVFSTHTDTELLVHLYEEKGCALADDLNGMFAFAIHDLRRNEVILGRDRTAQKPLFFHRRAGFFAFASELKTLLPVLENPRLHPAAVWNFLRLGYFLEPETLVCGIRAMEPGLVVRLNSGGEVLEDHAIPFPELEVPGIRSLREWMEIAEPVFERAVRRHTLSDVPVTVFLSGGVDSSLVTLLLAKTSALRAVQSGSFHDSSDHDEFVYAKDFASRLGLQCNRVDLGKRVLSDSIESFCADSSQPQGDYSGLPSYVLAKATAREFRVVLGGDAGDELFSGYPTYLYPSLRSRFGLLPQCAIAAGARVSRGFGEPGGYLPLRFRLQLLSQAWGNPPATALFQMKNFLPPELENKIFSRDFLHAGAGAESDGRDFFSALYDRENKLADPVRKLGRLDFHTFLRSCTLPKMERNCMRWSLENRLPFLDNEILALSARTSPELLRKGSVGKWCLRELLKKELGPVPLNPRKQGFAPPLAEMLAGDLLEWSRNLLAQSDPVFRPDVLETLESCRLAGWDLHRLVWNVCILKDWTARNRIAL